MIRRRPTTWMWAEACRMLAHTERLRERFFELDAEAADSTPGWQAPVDVFEDDRELIVWIALPGVAPESVEITLRGRSLRITGFRGLRIEPRTATIRRLEIPHGRLERRIHLPATGYVLEARDALHGCMRLHLRRP